MELGRERRRCRRLRGKHMRLHGAWTFVARLPGQAHAGGVDPQGHSADDRDALSPDPPDRASPEATNISFAGDPVLIDGTLGEYSLHRGSGTVHRRPGGAICVIPVGSQHRCRLSCRSPTTTPKTAEIVSKTLLLARDREIKGRTILEQLRQSAPAVAGARPGYVSGVACGPPVTGPAGMPAASRGVSSKCRCDETWGPQLARGSAGGAGIVARR
jgi:hypothetical protein